MNSLEIGKKIIRDITFFTNLCNEDNTDETIQEQLHSYGLHLHQDGYNTHTIQENCNNGKYWLNLYNEKDRDSEQGYKLLGESAKYKTLACLDSIIDALDSFFNETTLIKSNSFGFDDDFSSFTNLNQKTTNKPQTP